jgi:hypothetical protein
MEEDKMKLAEDRLSQSLRRKGEYRVGEWLKKWILRLGLGHKYQAIFIQGGGDELR